MIKAILFDKDGTLIDHDKTFGPATLAIAKDYAQGDEELFKKLCQSIGFDPDRLRFEAESPAIAATPDAHAKIWADVMGDDFADHHTKRLDEAYASAVATTISVFDGTYATLQQLSEAGYVIGLATNDAQENAHQQLAQLEIDHFFSFVAGYDSGFGGKPGPGMVNAFANHCAVDASQIIMVGDTLTDLQAGKAAGATCIGIASGTAMPDELWTLADDVINDIADLGNAIATMNGPQEVAEAIQFDAAEASQTESRTMTPKDTSIAINGTYRVIETEWITLYDGVKLAARLWMPQSADKTPTGAVLEFLPYRRGDGTAQRDEATYPAFAQAGIVGVRVDQRGTGDSEGLALDEYCERELLDALEIIRWIAGQPWCNGNVGMMGISWGGFNGIQVAALRPPELKAIISIASTVDRYNDDIHFKNGAMLGSNIYWATQMLSWNARSPDPAVVGNGWANIWRTRLDYQEFFLDSWLEHQRRDDYWKHGSICEDYSSIEAAVFVIAGWADGYRNTPPTTAANLKAPVWALNGPWVHKYPHFAYPHPRMDFLAEAIKFWNFWLNNKGLGFSDVPKYRAFISQDVKPSKWRDQEAGRWIAEENWPSPDIKTSKLFLSRDGRLPEASAHIGTLAICSPQDHGTSSGEFFTSKPDAEMPGDQREDLGGALVFRTDILGADLEILGRPDLSLRVACDQPHGNLVARLLDIHPDGTAHRVSWGVINTAHRHSNEFPQEMPVGDAVDLKIRLDETGYRFTKGHTIAIAISTSYWPMLIPPPHVMTAEISCGNESFLSLPVRNKGDEAISLPEPVNPSPLPEFEQKSPGLSRRWVEKDLTNKLTRYSIIEDSGEIEIATTGIISHEVRREIWTIDPDDPLSLRGALHFTAIRKRGSWETRSESQVTFRVDAKNYHYSASVEAFEGPNPIPMQRWSGSIARDLT